MRSWNTFGSSHRSAIELTIVHFTLKPITFLSVGRVPMRRTPQFISFIYTTACSSPLLLLFFSHRYPSLTKTHNLSNFPTVKYPQAYEFYSILTIVFAISFTRLLSSTKQTPRNWRTPQ